VKSIEQIHEELNIWHFPHHPWEVTIGNMHLAFNPKTLIMTWIVMIIIAVFWVWATRNMEMKKPSKKQLLAEEIFNFLRGLVNENLDPHKGASIMTLIFALFIFLLFSNLWGLVPTMMSPTADLNTTAGLAVMVFILVQILGFRYRGGGYVKYYLHPYPFFLPLTVVEELAKPVTLAFRLYGNIFAGEVLMAVLLSLIGLKTFYFLGFLPHVIWLAFSIFVGCIQAFIFTMLTIAYTARAVAEEEH
jgi:F-type H+-transporting ATPase subunit a